MNQLLYDVGKSTLVVGEQTVGETTVNHNKTCVSIDSVMNTHSPLYETMQPYICQSELAFGKL